MLWFVNEIHLFLSVDFYAPFWKGQNKLFDSPYIGPPVDQVLSTYYLFASVPLEHIDFRVM